ncbi:MAG TPA: hypothetical protein VG937_24270 [Polyangiaceae bacterium]|nr:hypothetical protein [Polyangiaceae bacterium]
MLIGSQLGKIIKTRSFAPRLESFGRFSFAVAVVGLAGAGLSCAGGSTNNGSGGSSGSTAGGSTSGGDAFYKPCAESMRIGAFSLELKPADMGNQAYSQVTGGVRDGVVPRTSWVEESVNGSGKECRLMVGQSSACSPACTSPQVCTGTTCQNQPVSKSVGEVTFSGLTIPVMMTPMITGTGSVVYSGLIPSDTTFPPYTVGAQLGLMATGADYPAFMLSGRGIQPLEAVAGQTLYVAKDQPLTIQWVAPQTGAGRIKLSMDIGHHGGVAAELHCDNLPDSGSVTIAAPLITALMNKGTSGFPTLSLSRVSVDSTSVGPGCVEFSVASGVSLALNVAGVLSCTEDADCAPPEICRPAGVPNGLSCGMP